eukprot:m.155279 g.155279  ORF g.155279 m.155279 type:complete len:315 (+) comp23559_c0_seq1:1257-2201(+)
MLWLHIREYVAGIRVGQDIPRHEPRPSLRSRWVRAADPRSWRCGLDGAERSLDHFSQSRHAISAGLALDPERLPDVLHAGRCESDELPDPALKDFGPEQHCPTALCDISKLKQCSDHNWDPDKRCRGAVESEHGRRVDDTRERSDCRHLWCGQSLACHVERRPLLQRQHCAVNKCSAVRQHGSTSSIIGVSGTSRRAGVGGECSFLPGWNKPHIKRGCGTSRWFRLLLLPCRWSSGTAQSFGQRDREPVQRLLQWFLEGPLCGNHLSRGHLEGEVDQPVTYDADNASAWCRHWCPMVGPHSAPHTHTHTVVVLL